MVTVAQNPQQNDPQIITNQTEKSNAAIGVVSTLFFLFGFITCLNDVLIPHLKELFTLTYAQTMLVQTTFFAAYFIVSWPASKLITKFGYKSSFLIGLILTALGCFSFVLAAKIAIYYVFLSGLFILASGVTIIQVAANPYLTIIGSKARASSRLIFAQGLNSLGTTIAPLIGSALILSVAVKTADEIVALSTTDLAIYRATQASSVQLPYIGLTCFVILIALALCFFKFPNNKIVVQKTNTISKKFKLFDHPTLVMGTIGIFAYVGAEVAIGSLMINFIAEPTIGNIPFSEAGKFLSAYWGGAMVGRFIGSYITTKIQPSKVLFIHAIIACTLVALTIMGTGYFALVCIVAVGLFNSIMFPTIFVLSTEKLGVHVEKGSGIICMAIVGGAVIPLIQGYIADISNLSISYIVPLICYVYIAFFALKTKGESITR
ncbi:sugar MFS transporter [Fluviispira multicolorata]|uniref:Glucose/galactose MFS transporter n=1 Tax=Fluviispira multicolorata TaxID=2654512 RepID=A0A833JG49_9BACT|nr:sugar MFS transporter [Fluviispira multicolorata]KAB8031946.1 glucose/galactose MFS transporter [Fluviispira multicolorata]